MSTVAELSVQRSVEYDLRVLRRQLYQEEKRARLLDAKTERMEEVTSGKKRRREDEGQADDESRKRLKSEVVVIKSAPEADQALSDSLNKQPPQEDTPVMEEVKREVDEQSEPAKPVTPSVWHSGGANAPAEQTTNNNTSEEKPQAGRPERPAISSEEKRGKRRLFGALVVGTLKSFQQQTEKQTDILQKRKQMEEQAEQKVLQESARLLEENSVQLREARDAAKIKVESLRQEIVTKEQQLIGIKLANHERHLALFLKTVHTPSLYFYPGKVDEWTHTTLGTHPRIEPATTKPASAEADRREAEAERRQEEEAQGMAPGHAEEVEIADGEGDGAEGDDGPEQAPTGETTSTTKGDGEEDGAGTSVSAGEGESAPEMINV